jgi:RNA polymerase sigma factor (sigma-70 family)
MAQPHPNSFLNHLRHLLGIVPEAALTDGQLLERFLTDRDETAVDVLVRRYGPLVFGVCRRVLHNAHAAEDAFQATFLILIRKASSLDRDKPLGSWLYTVAYRLALSARGNQLRRERREAEAARRRILTEDRATSPTDLVVALEEELQRLPERHRVPLVLCYLEGKTNEQAAEILGCPRGSMAARLAQARERLRACLARRGYAVPATGLAATLAAATTDAAVPLPLLANTVRAALWFVGTEANTAGFVSTEAVALARGALRAMLLNKLKMATAVLLTAASFGTGATIFLKSAPMAFPPAPTAEQPTLTRPERVELSSERLPTGVLARMGKTHLRHGDAVYFAAYTPDGQALVTAGKDHTVRLWELATGKEIRRFAWGEGDQTSKPILAADEIAQRWEHQLWDDLALSCQAALSSDGKTVAASRGGTVCLWETTTGKKLRQLQTGQKRLDQLAFSADGKSLLTLGPEHSIAVWEVATGACVQRREGKPVDRFRVSEYAATMEQIAVVSPGWKYLAFRRQAENDGPWSIKIKDRATGKEVATRPLPDGRAPLTFSPDEKTLVWAPIEGGIVCSDPATGKELRRVEDRSAFFDMASNFAFSTDGKSLAVIRLSSFIEIWDLTSGKQTYRFAPLGPVRGRRAGIPGRPALAFSPDGKTLVSSLGGATLRQFEVKTGKELLGPDVGRVAIPSHNDGHRASVSTLALSADGKSLWTYGRGDPVRIWDWATGKETGQRGLPRSATHAVFAADGRFAFADGKSITLSNADGKQLRTITAVGERLTALALSPDGALLAARSDDSAIQLWDTTTGKKQHTLRPVGDDPKASADVVTETTGVVTPVLVFSPDGRFLAGGAPRQLCLWDAARGNLRWALPLHSGQAIERFAFSPSGRVLGCVHGDGTVTLYEAVTGAKRSQLGAADPMNHRIHLTLSYNGGSGLMGPRRDAPVCLAFSPNGRYLAMAKETPQIHLWDVLLGREVCRLKGHEGPVVSLLFTPDGKHLISGGTDTTALTWDLTGITSARRGSPGVAKLAPKALDTLWTDLASRDAIRAFEAFRKLSTSPDQTVALLAERLRPASPPDPRRLAQLLADLQSEHFELRRQAETKLEELGDLTEQGLRQTLADEPPLDLRQRLERLLAKHFVPTVEQLRELRAVELLELIDTLEAREELQALARRAPGARLTEAAKSALLRLGKQTVNP